MKILMVSTVSNTVDAFLEPHIGALVRQGHTVDVACSVQRPLSAATREVVTKVHDVPLRRSPIRVANVQAWLRLHRIMKTERYDVVHVHTPVAALIGRLAALSSRIPYVVYTAHGFHFHNGAPLTAWLTYFPTEWLMSQFTDMLLTMNSEDHIRAKRHFKHPQILNIPGVGIRSVAGPDSGQIRSIRAALGINKGDVLIVSVGELNNNKSHDITVRALSHLPEHYNLAIAGSGPNHLAIQGLADDLDLSQRVRLLGHRADIVDLLGGADIMVHASKREGLPVAVMEAMRSGTPVVASQIRGVNDLLDDLSGVLINGREPAEWAHAIKEVIQHRDKFIGGPIALEPFTLESAVRSTLEIYSQIEANLT